METTIPIAAPLFRWAAPQATVSGFRILRPRFRRLGSVFLVLDAEPHREVALKQMCDNNDCDPDSRQRFLLEAEVIDCMEHSGIERVYELGAYANGRPYYAMRFIRCDSLELALTPKAIDWSDTPQKL
jgi:eukaryotic-like serine/threonine-protein kinase